MKPYRIALIVGVALAMPVAAHAQDFGGKTSAQQYLNDGSRALQLGNLVEAEVAFRRAILNDSASPYAHYLLANLFVKTGRHVEVCGAYLRAIELDPGTSIGEYSRQALKAYEGGAGSKSRNSTGVPTAAKREPSITNRKPGKTTRAIVNAARVPIPYKPAAIAPDQQMYAPTFTPAYPLPTSMHAVSSEYFQSASGNDHDVKSALNKIDEDAKFEKARDQQFATNLGRTTLKGGDWKANEIRAVAESEIAAVHSGRNEESARTYLRKQADARAKMERALAEERYTAHQEWAAAQQRDMDAVSNNLKDQLTRKPSPYGVDLVPEGTSLYVRNYKATPGKKKLADPRFSVARFVDRGMEDDVTSSPRP